VALSLKEFLRSEVRPAYGCTEPVAVALAVSRAREELELHCTQLSQDDIRSVIVDVSDSIYKNGAGVGIPGTGGARGNAIAAALGAIVGNSDYGLQVLQDVRPDHARMAREWVMDGRSKVTRNPHETGLYIKSTVSTDAHHAHCVIRNEHTNIAELAVDGSIITSGACDQRASNSPVSDIVGQMVYPDLLGLADGMDDEDQKHLLEGVRLCRRMAEYGLGRLDGSDQGMGIGSGIADLVKAKAVGSDLSYAIRMFCCAASDARMAGAPLPVMSSAGSGNHGITAILPVAMVGESLGKSECEIARSLAVSHLSTSFIKGRLGRLSPVCGCVVAAASGAAAGIVHIMGGDIATMILSMQTVLAGTAGMVCDGGKETCSLKVGIGATEAYIAALLAMQGRGVNKALGVVGSSFEETIDNIACLNNQGMKDVDKVIIDVLEARGGIGSL
jgi:L-cysteine desulfidase